MNQALIQKYAPTIASAAILLLGGLQVLIQTGATLVTILQFVALALSTVTTFGLRGRWKIALEIAMVLVAAILPFAIEQTFTSANLILILVAVIKALATHFGVVLRADEEVVPAIATVSTVEFQPGSVLMPNDGLGVDRATMTAESTDAYDGRHEA